MNCPNAPQKYSQEDDFLAMPLWQVLAKRGRMRAKFLRHNPANVQKIDCRDSLRQIFLLCYHASQPQNEEEDFYLHIMHEAVMARYNQLDM